MTGGKKPRQKGDRTERALVTRLRSQDLQASRVPLSGSAGGDYTGDLVISHPLVGSLRGEVKARKNGEGFSRVRAWLAAHDALFLVQDRSEPLVVLPWATWERLWKEVLRVRP
jgi:hypothetical protein